MRNLLTGNGINIQFDNKNYTTQQIVLRSFDKIFTTRRRNSRRDLFDYQPKSGTAVAYDYKEK